MLLAGAGAAGALAAGGLAQAVHMRRIAHDPERELLGIAAAGPRAGASPPPTGPPCTSRCSAPRTAPPVVLVHGWTEALQYWIYVIRNLSERGFRVVAYDQRGHGESEPGAGRRLRDRAVRRGPRGRAVRLRARRTAGGRRRPLARRDVDRRLGRGSRRRAPGRRGRAAQHRRRRPDRRAPAACRCPGIAKTLNRAISVHGFLGNRAPLPRFSTPLSYAAVRYIAFGRDASPAQVAFFERMLRHLPSGRPRQASGSRCPRWISTTQCPA